MSRAPSAPAPEVLYSPDALRRAWRMVRRNGDSPGTDGVSVDAFAQDVERQLQRLRDQILAGSYRPFPVQRYYVKKASGKNRPISVWAVRDRVAQRVVHEYLTPHLENIFLDCSYGFRPNRSVEDAINAIVDARRRNLRWVLDADITECFDSIPIHLMLSQAESVIRSELVLHLIKLWLNTRVARHQGERAGISQGSVISPQLANLYLHRFDQMIAAALPGSEMVRFADDFVILSRSRQDADWSMRVAKRSLSNLRLRMNMQKSGVVHFEEGFSFLGVAFKGKRYKPIEREN